MDLSLPLQRPEDRVLSVLSDGAWHSVREVARTGHVSPRSASKILQSLLSRGKILWKGIGARKHMYRLLDDSLIVKAKNRKPLLEDRIVDRLRQNIGDRFYFDGVSARRALDLLDWYSSLNLFEIHVPRKLAEKASEALNAMSDEIIVAPESLEWKFANSAMQIGALVKIIPQYNSREMRRLGDVNVVKVEKLLEDLRQRSEGEYKRTYEAALEKGLIAR